jgi:hypothetical protein
MPGAGRGLFLAESGPAALEEAGPYKYARESDYGPRMRYVVIDIEASRFDGFPIEVGWCDQDGNSESHLIRPAWNWTDWDIRAERVHGISREQLADRGEPYEAAAKLVADMLARCRREGVIVASDNPDYDREWLAKLLRRADIKDHVLLANNPELFVIAVAPIFAALPRDCHQGFNADRERAQIRGDAIIQAAKTRVAARPKHRAADDARRLRDIVEIIKAEVSGAIKQERRR